ncbi:MAG: PD-(D/E)XK nuclease family protein [Burkholderiaceae bacterium]
MAKAKLFDPTSPNPFALSRSKVELFHECPRCFYLDRRLGIGRPPGFPFNLNSAVDALLKKEFDACRAQGHAHPYMVSAGIDAVPHAHPQLDRWRANFTGVRTVHEASGFELFGAIDDLWRDNTSAEMIVVDYKATSKDSEVTLDAEWQNSYKRQMEFYQWLLRRQGLKVANQGWFVYCNGRRDLSGFENRLEFRIKLIPYTGSDDWVEPTLMEIRRTLQADQAPAPGANCDYCSYTAKVAQV